MVWDPQKTQNWSSTPAPHLGTSCRHASRSASQRAQPYSNPSFIIWGGGLVRLAVREEPDRVKSWYGHGLILSLPNCVHKAVSNLTWTHCGEKFKAQVPLGVFMEARSHMCINSVTRSPYTKQTCLDYELPYSGLNRAELFARPSGMRGDRRCPNEGGV